MSTSNQSISDIADYFGLYTYKDDLIYFIIENHDNWRHREVALRKDPFIKKYIKKLDEAILAEKPLTKPNIFGQKSRNPTEDTSDNKQFLNGSKAKLLPEHLIEEPEESGLDISEEWDKERWTKLLIKTMDKVRVHSFAVVQLYNTPPYWRVFCDREIKQINYNDKDVPISCKVEWTRNLPHQDEYVNYSETIHFFTGDLMELNENLNYGILIPFGVPESEDRLGEFDLEDKWSLAVYIRYALLDVVNNSAKSSGFYHLIYGDAIKSTQRQDLVNAIDMAGTGRAIGAKETVLKQIVAMYPAKPEFTIDALAEFIRQFAMACDMPLSYFRSESERSNLLGGTGEFGDDIQINKKMRYIFSQFKEHFKILIMMRWGILLDDIEPYILESEEEEIEVPINKENQNKEIKENDGQKNNF